MRFNSINSRLMVVGMFFIIGTSLAMAIIGIGLTSRYLGIRTERNFKLLASYMARSAELGILLDDRRMLERSARNMLEQKDVVRIVIKSTTGKILTDLGKTRGYSLNMEVEAPVLSANLAAEDLMFTRDRGKKSIGKVILTYSKEGLISLERTMAIQFILLAMVFSTIPMIVYWFLAKSIVAPLKDLVKVSRKVSEGDMTVRAKGGKLLETRTLAATFNDMLAAVKRHQEELDMAYREMSKQHAMAEMGKFSMMVAHEIKNPLAIIKGSLDILKKKDVSEETQVTMYHYLEEEIDRINKLVEDFLLFSRPTKPCFAQIEMNKTVAEVVQKTRLMDEGKMPEIVSHIEEKECILPCDRNLFERAVMNILKNALEICGADNLVTIETESNDHEWIVQIRDDGPGISPDDSRLIFEPFFTTKAKGTGLGLAVAKSIVEAHGGQLSAVNRKSGGACFEMKLRKRG